MDHCIRGEGYNISLTPLSFNSGVFCNLIRGDEAVEDKPTRIRH